MLRLYNRVVTMNNSRLPKHILNWDMEFNIHGWACDIKTIMIELNMYEKYTLQETICLKKAKEILMTKKLNSVMKTY